MRKLAILLACIQLSGCAGAYIQRTKEVKADNLTISDEPCHLKRKGSAEKTQTKSDVLNAWGKPKEIVRDGAGETWIYQGKERLYAGVVVAAIIPIPLMLPVSREKALLHFEDDRLMSISIRGQEPIGAVCGLVTMGPCNLSGPACEAFTKKDAEDSIFNEFRGRFSACAAESRKEPVPKSIP